MDEKLFLKISCLISLFLLCFVPFNSARKFTVQKKSVSPFSSPLSSNIHLQKFDLVKARSHRAEANAKAKKIKEQSQEIKEKN